MKSLVVCVLVAGCFAGGTTPTGPTGPVPEASFLATKDPARMRRLIRGPVINAGLWFSDPACRARFGTPGEVPVAAGADFAACLAGLDLRVSPRKDVLGDVFVLTYAPGFEIEARLLDEPEGPRLSFIGYAARKNEADALPTISALAMEQHRMAGDRNGPLDAAAIAKIQADGVRFDRKLAITWFKVCIDHSGNVVDVQPRMASSRVAMMEFLAVANAWQFTPFVVDGQPIDVCAMVRMGVPPEKLAQPEKLPFPPPPTDDGFILIPEGSVKRIAGEMAIVPQDVTKEEIRQSNRARVMGVLRVCADTEGRVAGVQMLQSTGFPAYDKRLVEGVRRWRYAPYRDDLGPTAVCTAVTFIYAQR